MGTLKKTSKLKSCKEIINNLTKLFTFYIIQQIKIESQW